MLTGKIYKEVNTGMSFRLTSQEAQIKKPRMGLLRFLGSIALLILVGVVVYSCVTSQNRINKLNAQLEELSAETTAMNDEAEKIQIMLTDDEKRAEYIEEVARRDFGYIKPNERIVYLVPKS